MKEVMIYIDITNILLQFGANFQLKLKILELVNVPAVRKSIERKPVAAVRSVNAC